MFCCLSFTPIDMIEFLCEFPNVKKFLSHTFYFKQMKLFKLLMLSVFCSTTLVAQKIVYKHTTDIAYYPESERQANPYLLEKATLDIYYPKTDIDVPVIVWFHGGGLASEAKQILPALKGKKMVVVSVDYRLSPIVKAEKCIVDAAAAVAWVFNNIEKYNGNPRKIFVSGHSAGGYLANMIGLDKRYLEKHDIDANDIAGLISFSGHTITHFTIRKEMGIAGTRPVIDKDAPPMLLITGDREKELLGRYEENAYFYRMMKVVGHKDILLYEMDGYGHNMVYPAIPLLLDFVNERSFFIDNKNKN